MATSAANALSAAARRRISERVARWQRRMNLESWSIKLEFKSNPKVAHEPVKACTAWEPNYQHGTITFATYAGEMDEEELDHLICHELNHLAEAREDDAISRYVGRGEVYKAWERANEAACDYIASVIVKAYKRRRRNGQGE